MLRKGTVSAFGRSWKAGSLDDSLSETYKFSVNARSGTHRLYNVTQD